jgi:peptidyl-prolyl cis-trans isomerase B (cyclophilin B)
MLMTILCGLWLPGPVYAQEGTTIKRSLVEVRTVLGTMIIALYNETPVHRDNFIRHVEAGLYDSLLFHRTVPEFMVEGGEPTSKLAPAGERIANTPPSPGLEQEIVPGLIHKHGALSASPASEDVDSLTHDSRFFIVLGVQYTPDELEQVAERNKRSGRSFDLGFLEKETYEMIGGLPRLDGGYTVFGEVVDGLDVLDALSELPCDGWDRPLTDVRMFMRVLK